MSNTEVFDNHLKYDGKNYYRVGAEDTYLGAYGEKKSPILQGNYLEVQDGIPATKIKVNKVVEAVIDWTKTTEANLIFGINVSKIFGFSADVAYDKMKSGHLHLYKLVVDLKDLENAAEDSPKHLKTIDNFGNDARIVSSIFVVLDATQTEAFSTATSFTVSVDAGIINVTPKNGGPMSVGVAVAGTNAVSVSAGSVYAYGLVEIKWAKDGTIEKLTDDQWGLS